MTQIAVSNALNFRINADGTAQAELDKIVGKMGAAEKASRNLVGSQRSVTQEIRAHREAMSGVDGLVERLTTGWGKVAVGIGAAAAAARLVYAEVEAGAQSYDIDRRFRIEVQNSQAYLEQLRHATLGTLEDTAMQQVLLPMQRAGLLAKLTQEQMFAVGRSMVVFATDSGRAVTDVARSVTVALSKGQFEALAEFGLIAEGATAAEKLRSVLGQIEQIAASSGRAVEGSLVVRMQAAEASAGNLRDSLRQIPASIWGDFVQGAAAADVQTTAAAKALRAAADESERAHFQLIDEQEAMTAGLRSSAAAMGYYTSARELAEIADERHHGLLGRITAELGRQAAAYRTVQRAAVERAEAAVAQARAAREEVAITDRFYREIVLGRKRPDGPLFGPNLTDEDAFMLELELRSLPQPATRESKGATQRTASGRDWRATTAELAAGYSEAERHAAAMLAFDVRAVTAQLEIAAVENQRARLRGDRAFDADRSLDRLREELALLERARGVEEQRWRANVRAAAGPAEQAWLDEQTDLALQEMGLDDDTLEREATARRAVAESIAIQAAAYNDLARALSYLGDEGQAAARIAETMNVLTLATRKWIGASSGSDKVNAIGETLSAVTGLLIDDQETQAALQAAIHSAWAIGSAAFGQWGAAAQHAAAAALFTSVAAGAWRTGGGGGGGGPQAIASQGNANAPAIGRQNNGGEPAQYNVYIAQGGTVVLGSDAPAYLANQVATAARAGVDAAAQRGGM